LLLIYLFVKITQFQHLSGWSSSEHQPYWSGGHCTLSRLLRIIGWFAHYRRSFVQFYVNRLIVEADFICVVGW